MLATVSCFRSAVPDAAARVASVPYNVVSSDEARVLAEGNPVSFLHVSRPEIDLPPGTDPHTETVYARAADNFAALRLAAPLVIEDAPRFYVYRLTMGAHTQSGVAACFSVDEYNANLIRKHEKTRPDKEDDRTRHLLAIGAQTGPVFLTYRASASIDAVVQRTVVQPPLYDFVAGDDVRHEVWHVAAGEAPALVEGFAALPALYIADGHHRAASAARAREAMKSRAMASGIACWPWPSRTTRCRCCPTTASCATSTGSTGGVPGRGPLAWTRLRTGGPASPATRGQVAIRVGGAVAHDDAFAAADTLDVDMLEREVLTPILGIAEVRTDPRIEFVGGIRGTEVLERCVDAGAVRRGLLDVSGLDADLMRIADEGGIMPPKSTWFEPKLRDGLLSHLIG